MSLRKRLDEDLKTAMKAKDEIRLSVIRMVRSSVKNKEIELKKELDDQAIIEVVSTLVKQRRESLKMFKEAGRDDLVSKEERELELLLDFLPRQLSAEEIGELVDRAIAESGARGAADMGKVMKLLMPQTAGRADGKQVSEIVKSKLA